MVNAASAIGAADRRARPRVNAKHALALGVAPLNPFGDLVSLQHLCARLAKALKGPFAALLRQELRSWAEPLVVQRYADYKAERGEALAAWVPLAMGTGRHEAQMVLDGGQVFAMLDLFFGGEGDVPEYLPTDLTPAACALLERLAGSIVPALDTAWEPLARISFGVAANGNFAQGADIHGEEPVVVTRFGIAAGDAEPYFIDLLYPVSALKPHAPALMVKVHREPDPVEPEWRSNLTRAAMQVTLPVRSVLCEPRISLGRLMDLKAGDIIPVDIAAEVPVMVASRRLGKAQAGTSNGRAAVRLLSLETINSEDFR